MSLLEQEKRVLGLGVTGLGTRGVWGHNLEFGAQLKRVSFDELHLKWYTTLDSGMSDTKEKPMTARGFPASEAGGQQNLKWNDVTA